MISVRGFAERYANEHHEHTAQRLLVEVEKTKESNLGIARPPFSACQTAVAALQGIIQNCRAWLAAVAAWQVLSRYAKVFSA